MSKPDHIACEECKKKPLEAQFCNYRIFYYQGFKAPCEKDGRVSV